MDGWKTNNKKTKDVGLIFRLLFIQDSRLYQRVFLRFASCSCIVQTKDVKICQFIVHRPTARYWESTHVAKWLRFVLERGGSEVSADHDELIEWLLRSRRRTYSHYPITNDVHSIHPSIHPSIYWFLAAKPIKHTRNNISRVYYTYIQRQTGKNTQNTQETQYTWNNTDVNLN